jgi:hypothetical protein
VILSIFVNFLLGFFLGDQYNFKSFYHSISSLDFLFKNFSSAVKSIKKLFSSSLTTRQNKCWSMANFSPATSRFVSKDPGYHEIPHSDRPYLQIVFQD